MDDKTVQPSAQPTIKQILIIEDDKDYRDVLTELLEQEGFGVLNAENGEVGMGLIKNTNVDLILLDVLMPQMDGFTFYNHMKNDLKKNIPVIMLTNFTTTARPDGIADFIIKSNTSLDEVLEKIKRIFVKQ
jgi:DNA-binding response OmpR family regulator